ncbi:MAG TPA: SRPBCC domain-containing protein [Polyangia bacterium]
MTSQATPSPKSFDKTDRAQKQAVTFELDLRHAPAKVWRALTEPALLAEWLLPVFELKLEPGAAFMFKTQAYPGWDGTVSCRMLEIEPQRKLSYQWDVPFLQTVVTFTLTPTAEGTNLRIVQSGFKPEQQQEFGGARYGWTMMTGKLVELLARTA